MTGNDLIASSLRAINGLASGEVVDAAVARDALAVLNSMFDSFSAESLMIFNVARQTFPLQAGKQTYTLGLGGDFNISRPPQVNYYGIINATTNPVQPVEYQLQELSDDEWGNILVKQVTGLLPRQVWDDRNYPLRRLNFWPQPNIDLTFVLHYWTALQKFADLVSNYAFPPGYEEALKYNLAIRLAAENFGEAASPVLLQMAAEAKGKIAVSNSVEIPLHCDPSAIGRPSTPGWQWYKYILGY